MARSTRRARRRWPSIEEQLGASNIRRGSALEQLVKDNQNFTLLRPEEAHDDLGFPLWLRVFVRKAHPEIDFGPKVGYPLIIKEMLGYMLRHQDAPLGPTASKP